MLDVCTEIAKKLLLKWNPNKSQILCSEEHEAEAKMKLQDEEVEFTRRGELLGMGITIATRRDRIRKTQRTATEKDVSADYHMYGRGEGTKSGKKEQQSVAKRRSKKAQLDCTQPKPTTRSRPKHGNTPGEPRTNTGDKSKRPTDGGR